MPDEMDTNQLMKMLQTGCDKSCFSGNHNLFTSASFAEILINKAALANLTDMQLAAAASISKTYIYQLLRGERRPGRDIVLRLSLVLHLSVDETQKLLTVSGNSVLYPRIRRDAAVIFSLGKKMALAEAEYLLSSLQERTLYGSEG